MSLIEIKNLTKDYGQGQGIFDINLSIEKGEAFGYVGINGAGKTTTIRHLLGFLNPQSGSAAINGLDCWIDSAEIKRMIGYVPGEIAFPDAPTGTEFLKRQAELLGLNSMAYGETLINKLQLDPSANLKRMSKGMKQKTAVVAALMADPAILILDEPSTGLDPLMRAEFIAILKEEKKKGKTIFMSSHMFEEIEQICDRVAFIKNGKIISIKPTDEIKHNENKAYEIEFTFYKDYLRFLSEEFEYAEQDESKNQVTLNVHDRQINDLFKALKRYEVKSFTEIKPTLEKYFKGLYEGGKFDV